MHELTHEQIQKIENYCEQQGVIFYDVKLEIVDHIATIIEQQLIHNSTLTFESIFHSTNTGFDKKAINKIIKEKEIAIATKNKKRQLDYLKSFFSFPKVITTIGYIIFSFFIIKYLTTKEAFAVACIIYLPAFLLNIYHTNSFFGKENYYIKKKIHQEEKKYTQIQKLLIFNRKNNSLFLVNLILAISNLFVSSTALNYIHPKWLACTILFTLGGFSWIALLAFLHQKKNLIEYAIKNYPEAFQLSQN
ncbi:MAG: hypothetical protein DI598_12625 [Pseudopedobacter saltans]|uniref:Uncharacterized protein n=1 Tax=Pseudopedobacter saltans TaxID=151895 RepID=A0A2W5EPP1_9SPHI|nr:MAG: hypothetical protein DI598_12625 [Pseudopedobacter saltans]